MTGQEALNLLLVSKETFTLHILGEDKPLDTRVRVARLSGDLMYLRGDKYLCVFERSDLTLDNEVLLVRGDPLSIGSASEPGIHIF